VKILVANIGSTSFKYRLYEMRAGALLASGKFERIGRAGGECASYQEAIDGALLSLIGDRKPLSRLSELTAVGFKAVHAGPLSGARLVDERVLRCMEEFSFFAPAHNPPYLAAMRAFRQAAPQVPQVALFESAFFQDLPEEATAYAVPYEWKDELHVRRYGFHGASHRHAAETGSRKLPLKDLRHVSCHLGGSSSLAALRAGRAVDTSFGMSPQSGLPHNNRVGDLDVFAALYVMRKKGLDVDQMAEILSTGSGLAGLSGTSGDMRDLTEAAAAGQPRARLALDLFVRTVRHYLGAFLLELGGVDLISFSGGIGENSAPLRASVCRDLREFGIILDPALNEAARGEARISAADSRAQIWVFPADEEWIVARAAAEAVGLRAPDMMKAERRL
jgi:acetate kinase